MPKPVIKKSTSSTKFVVILGSYNLIGVFRTMKEAQDEAVASGDVEDVIIFECTKSWIPVPPTEITWVERK